jgi:CHAD domain-containing protein
LNINLHFKFPEGYTKADLERLIGDSYSFRVDRPVSEKWVLYDTFDWRLFNKSLTMYQSDLGLFLLQLPNGEVIHRLAINTTPRFVWDLPESPLKEQIYSIIEPRAFLKLAELSMTSHIYRILDANTKTVARIVFTQVRSITHDEAVDIPEIPAYLKLIPVRGYSKCTQQLVTHLEQAGLIISCWNDLFLSVLDAVGKKPGSYSSKIDVQLEPNMRSDEATKVILRMLFQVMKVNKPGVHEDIDIEFLHDYRVAIRRTRSALGQIKGVFPTYKIEQFKQDFAYLGSLTNELRDLDVYLLAEDKYKSMLPESLQDDISPLFEYLRKQRGNALKQVIKSHASAKYKHILAHWEVFLNEPVTETPGTVKGTIPIIELARQRIYTRYRRVIKDGNNILENPQDELMHALRIDCKKLRYLIEFFASLFPEDKIRQLIEQLKRLQDNLGDFNDLSVQQEYLLNIADQLPITDQGGRRTLLAIGSLIKSLVYQQQRVKDAFAETFTTFASASNQKLYNQLFSKVRDRLSS